MTMGVLWRRENNHLRGLDVGASSGWPAAGLLRPERRSQIVFGCFIFIFYVYVPSNWFILEQELACLGAPRLAVSSMFTFRVAFEGDISRGKRRETLERTN